MTAHELPDVPSLRRKLKRYNLSQVARETDIDRHQLYRIVKGESRPSYETARKLLQWMADNE